MVQTITKSQYKAKLAYYILEKHNHNLQAAMLDDKMPFQTESGLRKALKRNEYHTPLLQDKMEIARKVYLETGGDGNAAAKASGLRLNSILRNARLSWNSQLLDLQTRDDGSQIEFDIVGAGKSMGNGNERHLGKSEQNKEHVEKSTNTPKAQELPKPGKSDKKNGTKKIYMSDEQFQNALGCLRDLILQSIMTGLKSPCNEEGVGISDKLYPKNLAEAIKALGDVDKIRKGGRETEDESWPSYKTILNKCLRTV